MDEPVCSEATSVKWPWEALLMKHSCSTHRYPYSGGRQQQHQRPPQRDPVQSEVHSQTPSICVSPLLIPPCSQHGDEPLHHSSSSQREELAQPSQESLWYTLQGAYIHHQNQLLNSCPRALHRWWCSSTSQTWMIWVNHCNCPLTWLASSNGLKMLPMTKVTLRVCLPPQTHALWYNPRQPSQRGRVTSGTLQLPGEPHPGPALLHLQGLQLWGNCTHTTKCWTLLNSPGTGSGHALGEWENHPTGGLSSSLCTRGLKRGCTAADQETGCKFLTSHNQIWKNGMVESWSQSQCPTL